MDSFSKEQVSKARADLAVTLDEVKQEIVALKEEYASKGIELSGRIIHVTHYIPITVSLAPSKTGVLSPPLTPPVKPTDVALSPTEEEEPSAIAQKVVESVPAADTQSDSNTPRWILGTRWGHSAMFSGIQSLSNANEQLIVGWTGDLERGSASTGEKVKVPLSSVSDDDRKALTAAIEAHKTEDGPTKYVPVWLDDKIAHGHYDGYCKTSRSILISSHLNLCSYNSGLLDSSLAPVPLPPMAGRRDRSCER